MKKYIYLHKGPKNWSFFGFTSLKQLNELDL